MVLFLFWCLGCTVPEDRAIDKEGPPKNVVFLLVDTLRADAIEKSQTPTWDDLVKRGQSPKKTWAPSTWTAASVISMFSGQHMREHGWDHPMPKYLEEGQSYPPIPVKHTLPEVLKGAGFETHGFFANQLLRRDMGFERGFDSWSFTSDAQMVRKIRRHRAGLNDQKRHFFYIHLYGVHQPLRPSADAMKRWNIEKSSLSKKGGIGLRALRNKERAEIYKKAYHAVLEDVDQNIGRILEALGPVAEDALIVVTSDHGELLGEDGKIGHEAYLYEALTAVPFVAVGGVPLEDTFSLTGVADFVCRSVGVDWDWSVKKDSSFLVAQRASKLAILNQDWMKGIWRPELEVYHLATDPLEQKPVLGSEDVLQDIRSRWEQKVPKGSSQILDKNFPDDVKAGLKELGYLE